MISIQRITKAFGARTVLRDVSVAVEKSEFVALVGPSGGGKSTLLRCINALEYFDSGAITVAGETLIAGHGSEQTRAARRVQRRVGFVFQQWHLFAHMTVLQNIVEAPVHVLGESPASAEKHARELIESVGMSHRIDAKPRALSGGEQQRIAIARALAMRPAALLMDEPTSALDPERVAGLTTLLRSVAKERELTIIFVTHDIDFAERTADRIVELRDGQIARDVATART